MAKESRFLNLFKKSVQSDADPDVAAAKAVLASHYRWIMCVLRVGHRFLSLTLRSLCMPRPSSAAWLTLFFRLARA